MHQTWHIHGSCISDHTSSQRSRTEFQSQRHPEPLLLPNWHHAPQWNLLEACKYYTKDIRGWGCFSGCTERESQQLRQRWIGRLCQSWHWLWTHWDTSANCRIHFDPFERCWVKASTGAEHVQDTKPACCIVCAWSESATGIYVKLISWHKCDHCWRS